MDEHVVVVEESDHRVAVQREVLKPVLGEDVAVAFEVDHPTGIRDGLLGVVAREVPDLAIPEEDRPDQGEFSDRA